MNYQFQDMETGEEVEVDLPAAKAPDFGAIIKHKGRRLKRLFTAPAARVAPNVKVVGMRRDYGVPGADAYMDPVTRKVNTHDVTGDGVPLWDSKSSMNRTEKLTNGAETFAQLKPDN